MNVLGLIIAGVLIAATAIFLLFFSPSRYRRFSYRDQQRSFRAFDRSEFIDAGMPSWARSKNKGSRLKLREAMISSDRLMVKILVGFFAVLLFSLVFGLIRGLF